MAEIRVGISGWTYAPWRGVFYKAPNGAKLPQKQELAFASRRVTSIEINGTFYRLQKPESFRQWYAETPDDFRFSVKANKFLTHVKRLKDVEQVLSNFLASGILCLKDKLGPILWQLPPNLPRVDSRFEDFMALLPKSSQAASALAARHDDFVSDPWTDPGGDYPVRHAFEFRHESFRDADFIETMRRHDVALVFADSGEHGLGIDDVTADHVYVRMHGQGDELSETGYPEAALQRMAERIELWSAGKQPEDAVCISDGRLAGSPRLISVYFDNDAKAHAPRDAMRLIEILAARKAGRNPRK